MQSAFTSKRLAELRKLVRDCLGLELDENEVYDCITSVLRMVAGKALRGQTSGKENMNV